MALNGASNVEVLAMVGRWCRTLRELNVASGAVTDRGLFDLIFDDERRCTQVTLKRRVRVWQS